MKTINIKKLRLKEMYKWPLLSQSIAGLILAILVLIGGVFFLIIDQYSELEQARKKEEDLKLEFINKTQQAVNLNLYKEQLVEITQASDALLKQLPNKSEVEKLLIDINQSGIGRGLQFQLFRPNPEKVTEYYAELPISIKVNGSYDALGKFASDVSQLSRVVILKDITINNFNSANGTLTMIATAQTFRYLDQDEIDKQKSEKKEKLKKIKKGENKNEDK